MFQAFQVDTYFWVPSGLVVNRTFGAASTLLPKSSVRFGSPNSVTKFWPNSSDSWVRPNFKIGKVRFGSVRRKNSEFGSPLVVRFGYFGVISKLPLATLLIKRIKTRRKNPSTLGYRIIVPGRLFNFEKSSP